MSFFYLLIPTLLLVSPNVKEPPQAHDGLAVRLWVDDDQHNYYDPLFVRVTVTNISHHVVQFKYPLREPAWFKLTDEPFCFRYPNFSTGGGSEPRTYEMDPGEEWIVHYAILQMPPLEMYDHSFWKGLAGNRIQLTAEVRTGHTKSSLFISDYGRFDRDTINIRLKDRPESESEYIRQLYADLETRQRFSRWMNSGDVTQLLKRQDSTVFTLESVGLYEFRPFKDFESRMFRYEDELTAGSLRDIVHLTRLMQELADEENVVKQVERADKVLHFLDTLPQIERENFLMQLPETLPYINKNPAWFRLADGVFKRMPKSVYHYEDYPAYRLETFSRGKPEFQEYVKKHVGEDYKAEPEKDLTPELSGFDPFSE